MDAKADAQTSCAVMGMTFDNRSGLFFVGNRVVACPIHWGWVAEAVDHESALEVKVGHFDNMDKTRALFTVPGYVSPTV